MIVYFSKYAISTGRIERLNVDVTTSDDGRQWASYTTWNSIPIGKGAHLNRADAVAEAERMRTTRIALLEKQLNRLRNLRFNK